MSTAAVTVTPVKFCQTVSRADQLHHLLPGAMAVMLSHAQLSLLILPHLLECSLAIALSLRTACQLAD